MLGILLLSERRYWPPLVVGGVAGSVASDLFSGFSPGMAAAAALANGAESLLAALLLRACCGPAVALSSLRTVGLFLLGAVLLSNGLTAALGALTLQDPFPRAWLTWWVGDGMGMLIVTPVILAWSRAVKPPAPRPAVALEAVVLAAILATTAQIALGAQHRWLLGAGPYALFPLLAWASLRFGPTGAAGAMAVVAGVTITNASLGHGPFTAAGHGSVIAAQSFVFLAIASVASLVPAAVQEERETARRAVAESERRYRNLFEANPMPMWLCDADSLVIIEANHAAVARYGYARADLLCRSLPDLSPDDDRAAMEQWLRGTEGQALERRIWRHRIADGSVIEVEVSWHAMTLSGRPALVVQAMDLTEQRRAEESLRATRERLEHVVASSGAVIFEMPAAGRHQRLEWVSSNITAVLGHRLEDALGEGWWTEQVHPEDRNQAAGTSTGAPAGFTEYRFRDGDGRWRWLREERRSLKNPGGRPDAIVGTWIDVTQWRELETQLRQSQKMEAIGRLAGSIAHDFNNLLTVILGEADAVLSDPRVEDDEQRASLDAIRGAAERAALLTRQLLMFSRRQMVAPAPLGLNDVVTAVDRMLHRLLGENVRIVLRLDAEPRLTMADRGQVEQLLVNLAVNARDAMPGGGTLTIETATVDLDAGYAAAHPGISAGPHVMLAVSDTGTGMSEEVKQHLFEPFFTTKESGKGTGLGLATCYAIARQYRGGIHVYSESGVGSTVRVYLPALPSGALAPQQPARPAVRGGHETILLVEDERDVRRIAARTLRNLGYTVHEAGDGPEAADFLRARVHELDLLLTDVVLPHLGGREIADLATQLRPEVRVLFSSGYSADLVIHSRLLGREAALLQKPFTAEALAAKVRSVLDAPAARPDR